MYYFLPVSILLLGLVLIIFFTPLAWRKRLEQTEDLDFPPGQTSTEAPLLEYLQSLEAEIGLLKDDFSSFRKQVEPPEIHILDRGQREGKYDKSFDTVLAEKQNLGTLPDMELYRAVFQAHDAGKSLTEIARELGRGKGEIELILNLRR